MTYVVHPVYISADHNVLEPTVKFLLTILDKLCKIQILALYNLGQNLKKSFPYLTTFFLKNVSRKRVFFCLVL